MRLRLSVIGVALLVVAAALLAPQLCAAYEPHAGNRAAELTGADLLSGRTINLDQYLGRWVLLEFWSSS